MPTVLGGKGKLSVVYFLLRCAYSQVTRNQHNSCAKDILEDMTQSWPSQQALGGDQAQRILYNPKDAKQPTTQQRQSRGDVQLRMTRHPHVAPHKSMLADDLKLSSDEDETQRATHESTSWDGHSLSAQRVHTHGRRVRHSSSDSSASDSSGESSSSSLHSRSRSRSPGVPVSPSNTQPLRNRKESDHPSAAQWQLDKWLKKARKKSSSGEQDPSQSIPGRLPSPHTQRAPSPARSWDSNQEYSPSQTPIPSPQFNYRQNHSPPPSPGYSFCPSPFPSTCPSPSPSPKHSPIPSPVLSVCPCPRGSPRPSRSPSPIPRDPPRSPSPSLPSSRVHQVQGHQTQPNQTQHSLTATPHSKKTRSWNASLSNSGTRNKDVNSTYPQQPHQYRHKTRPAQDQDLSQNKSKTSSILNSNPNHKSRSRPNFNQTPNQLTETRKSRQTPNFEQRGKSIHKSQPSFHLSSQHRSTKPKHSTATSCENSGKAAHSSHSLSTSKTAATGGSSFGSSPSLKSRAKSGEAAGPTSGHVSHLKPSQKKPESKEQEGDHRELHYHQHHPHHHQVEGRQHERKEDRRREKPQAKPERKEDRRLAEEQLLRRPWIQSSEEDEEEEEEEEEEGAAERQRRKEETARGENQRRREQHHRREWQTVQAKQRLPTSTEQHRLQDDSHHQKKTKKGGRTEEDKDASPPPSRTPTPTSPSSESSTSSSSLDTESEYQAPITKVPADSTSQRINRRQQCPGRADTSRLKAVHPRGPSTTVPSERQQSECKQKLYTLVPFGRGEKTAASSHRGLRNLVVQIDLSLLKRVPDSTTCSTVKKPSSSSSSSTKDKQREAMKHLYVPEPVNKDSKRKRKLENGVSHRESKRSVPYANDLSGRTDSSSHRAEHNFSTETTHNGYLEEYLDSKRPLSPLSPLSDSPESTKPSSQIKTTEQHHVHKSREKNRDSAVKPKMEVECVKVSKHPQASAESWGPSGHRGTMPNHETPHHAEYYLHEAKRMKHRADAMVDKLGKAVNYVDAALSFMECGKAMEEGPLEAKSPYTMYSETVELIRYAMRLKSHSGPGARQEDKQLAVLCFRCLALLYWQMFRLKKDHALKYSKVLLDYFKSSPKVPPAPVCWTDSDSGKGVGTPSSLSPNAKHLGRGSQGGSTSPSLISIPQRIHQMAANHLNITNSVLYSYEYWEVADNLAKENKEFFNYLNTLSGPLTLHSSIAHAVQYTRQALQWIRISAKLN